MKNLLLALLSPFLLYSQTEENYFRNTNIDKKDQKLLDEYLNNLD